MIGFLMSCVGNSEQKENSSIDSIAKADSINKVKWVQDSIQRQANRDSIFNALGDTVYGNVLYGMDYKNVQKTIADFRHRMPYYSDSTFRFSDFDFFVNTLNCDKYSILDYKYRKNNSLFWKGELCSIVWKSLKKTDNSAGGYRNRIMKLIKFFENKYGETEYLIDRWAPSDYFNVYHMKGRFICTSPEKTICIWETQNRRIFIETILHHFMVDDNDSRPYEYEIRISFQNKPKMDEINSYYNSAINKRREQDSIQTLKVF